MSTNTPPLPLHSIAKQQQQQEDEIISDYINSDASNLSPPPTPILLMAQKRNFSSSMRGTIAMPRCPSLPPTPCSPRKRLGSNSSLNNGSGGSDKLASPNLSQERAKMMLDVLDRNEAKDTLYRKCDNCSLYPKNAENDPKSYYESKFMKREYPSYFSTDRQFFRFLMHQFNEALKGVNERYPNYYSIDKVNDFQMSGMINELDMWFTLFDECINQESQHSKVNAYLMKNIMEVFQQDFTILIEQIKRERAKIEEVKEYYRKKDETSDLNILKEKYEYVTAENDRIKREMEALHEENKKFHVENFNLRAEIQESQNSINGLLNTTNQLRQTISAGEQKIHDMIKEKPQAALEASFTAVPKEVLESWTQCSQFLTSIMNDSLLEVDLNKIFPEDLASEKTLGCYLSLNRPDVITYDEENVHFSKLYYMIKMFAKGNEPSQLFETLVGKIRALFHKFASFYLDRTRKLRTNAKETEKRLNKQLFDLRKSIPNPSEWISNVVNYPELYLIPKKSPDLQGQILFVFQKAEEMMKELNKPQSASDIVTKLYQGQDLLLFLAQIAKLSRTDIHTDMFRQFLTEELPFHMFLYYSKIIIQNDKADLRKRTTFLTSQFQPVGWNSIPQLRRRSYETMYCPSPVTFPIFTLAVYQHAIENIAISIADIVDQSDLKGFFMRKYNDQNMLDYMVAMAEKGEPTIIEYAAILFFKKEKFENANEIISDFDPQQSKLIEYMSTFGQKKDKKKQPKKAGQTKPRSQSVKMNRTMIDQDALTVPEGTEISIKEPPKEASDGDAKGETK